MDRFLFISGIIVWDKNAITSVILMLAAMALGLFLWWRFFRPTAMPPKEVIEASEENDVAEGPGQLLVRFQTLQQDFELATRELQRFNGSREVQLQGWQQLSADVIRRILPVLANLEPYLEDTDSQAADVAQLAYGRLLTELVTIGVTQIIPSPGEAFNGKYHVLGPDSEGYPPYRVKSVVQPGYLFQPRILGASEIVLKPAEIIVESETEYVEIETAEGGDIIEPAEEGVVEPEEDIGMVEPEAEDGIIEPAEEGIIEPVEDNGMLVTLDDDGMIVSTEEDNTIDPIEKSNMMVSLFEQMPAAMALDGDDAIEIVRVPLSGEEDDDAEASEIKRMPSPLPDEE